nr:hypothetical protein [Streptomyces sp. SID5910]
MLRHQITVEPYAGDSAYGPTYGPPAEVAALVTPNIRTVRNAQGREVTATAQIITAPGLDCPPESRITLPGGRVTRAISVADYTAPGLPVPECTEVNAE